MSWDDCIGLKDSSFRNVLHTLIGPVWEFLSSISCTEKEKIPPGRSRLVIYTSDPVAWRENKNAQLPHIVKHGLLGFFFFKPKKRKSSHCEACESSRICMFKKRKKSIHWNIIGILKNKKVKCLHQQVWRNVYSCSLRLKDSCESFLIETGL